MPMHPVVESLRALVTASRIQAVVAVVGAGISGWGAYQSFKSEKTVKEDADKVERQIKAAEAIAQQAQAQAAAAERQAKAAERSLAEVRDLASATRSLKDEAARSVEVAKDQLAQTKADSYATRRARVRITNTDITRRVVGYPLFAEMQFKNIGVDEPLKVRIGSMVARADPKQKISRSMLLKCANTPIDEGNWMEGRYWRESISNWTQADEEAFLKGLSNIYVYGRICYTDSANIEHMVDFCGVHFGGGGAQQCGVVDP